MSDIDAASMSLPKIDRIPHAQTLRTKLFQVVIEMLVRQHAPFPPGQWTKQWMSRTFPLFWTPPDLFQEMHHCPTLLVKRRVSLRVQLNRGGRPLRKRQHVQNKVLQWKHLERSFIYRRNRMFAQSHPRREPQMLQHTDDVHLSPSRRRRGCQGVHPAEYRSSLAFIKDRTHK